MANEAQYAKIRDALTRLDPADNEQWTDDGLPKTAAVQALTNDQSIRRQDIQAAQPGFQRPTPKDAATDDFGAPLNPPAVDGGTTLSPPETPAAAGAENELGEELTEDEVHAILAERVAAYEQAGKDARMKQAEGAKEEQAALKAFNAARAELVAAFPPRTEAQNIKEYLASEQAKRAARAEHGYGTVRLDQAFGRGNARGWRRPTRGVVGPDGSLIKGADGQIVMPRAMQVRPQARTA